MSSNRIPAAHHIDFDPSRASELVASNEPAADFELERLRRFAVDIAGIVTQPADPLDKIKQIVFAMAQIDDLMAKIARANRENRDNSPRRDFA